MLATESVVLKLCEGQPPAASVRVDAMPFVDGEGQLGHTLAATIVERSSVGRPPLRERRVGARELGADPERLTLPDGSTW